MDNSAHASRMETQQHHTFAHDPTELSNFRPIGLCNTLYKLWTSHINKLLTTYLEEHNLLYNGQEGFRRKRNTKRQIKQLQLMYANACNRQKQIIAQGVDFSSAFNTASHAQMIAAMKWWAYPKMPET